MASPNTKSTNGSIAARNKLVPARALKFPREIRAVERKVSSTESSFQVTGWWADGQYGDNSETTPPDELSAGEGSENSTTGWKWGDLPLEIDQVATIEIPDQNGDIVFTVAGDNGSAAVSHSPASNVNIARIRTYSGACAGAKSAWLNVVVTFYKAQGGSYTTPNMDASESDGQGMGTDPPESTFDIVPPPLQAPNYYNRALIVGWIHFRSDAEVQPDPNKLYARVQALSA